MNDPGTPRKLLVIGTWGFPGGWRKAKYNVPLPPDSIDKWWKVNEWGHGSNSIESHSTTMALSCALAKDCYMVETLIIGLDTLVAISQPNCGDDELCRRLYEEAKDYACPVSDGGGDHLEYWEIKEKARSILKIYVKGYVEELGDCLLNNDFDFDLAILPGTGNFSCKLGGVKQGSFLFRGSPLNSYALMRVKLLERLLEKGFDAVILDVSHGINYLPVLAKSAVLEAVETYSALSSKKVGLAVVNSDPPFAAPGDTVDVHLVEARIVRSGGAHLIASRAQRLGIDAKFATLRKQGEPPELFKELNGKFSSVFKKWKHLISVSRDAIEHGLIVYLATELVKEAPDKESVDELIYHLEKATYLRDLRIMECSECRGIIVSQDQIVHPNAVDLIDVLLLLSHLAEKTRIKANTLEIGGTHLISIDHIEKMKDEIKLSSAANTILEKEINDLKLRVKLVEMMGVDLKHPVVYGSIMDLLNKSFEYEYKQATKYYKGKRGIDLSIILQLISEKHMKECKIDSDPSYYRNLLAHAGLEKESTIVVKRNSNIYVGYREECLKKIRKMMITQ